MDFSAALSHLKQRRKIRRSSWQATDYIVIVDGCEYWQLQYEKSGDAPVIENNYASALGDVQMHMAKHIVYVSEWRDDATDVEVTPGWCPSQADLFGEDWEFWKPAIAIAGDGVAS